MAFQGTDQFRRLATETVTLFAGVPNLTTGDLAAFAATCRRHYDVANPFLYRKNVEEEHEIAGMDYL